MKRNLMIILAMLLLLLTGVRLSGQAAETAQKKRIKVVITDSGLGGLSVMDDIAKKLNGSGYYKEVELIFVNALFDADRGYNALPSREEKIDVFNSVLYGIEKNFHPDIILIGCNTLSVLYRETDFVKNDVNRVLGIVDPGVELIADRLSIDRNSAVIITGTVTTISENSHKVALLAKDFAQERIITQACPELQSYIEHDPYGEDTEMLISVYVEEAISQLKPGAENIYLSLNCSHFGYSSRLWERVFRDYEKPVKEILNPNFSISDPLLPEENRGRFRKTKIGMYVYSKVELKNKDTMYDIFRDSSPGLAKVLDNYILDDKIF